MTDKTKSEPEDKPRKHWLSLCTFLILAVVEGIAGQNILAIGMLAISIFIVATDNE